MNGARSRSRDMRLERRDSHPRRSVSIFLTTRTVSYSTRIEQFSRLSSSDHHTITVFDFLSSTWNLNPVIRDTVDGVVCESAFLGCCSLNAALRSAFTTTTNSPSSQSTSLFRILSCLDYSTFADNNIGGFIFA
jgi:hypothetical protein